MYSILNESLGWSETSLPSEKLMLISDSLSADGAFLLPHFINFYVKSKQRVIIVGLEQGFSHYLSICKKLVRFMPLPTTLGGCKLDSLVSQHLLRLF